MKAMETSGELVNADSKKGCTFYEDAAKYWAQIPATVDGMLGGFGFISHTDIQGSNQFLRRLFKLQVPPGKARALDCGAGIGRITKNLLFNHFEKVDIVEQNPAFVEQARSFLSTHKRMGNFYCAGLQDFVPAMATYDVIWCQWVLSHLTDDDLVAFLNASKRGLKPNGVIVVKENVTFSGKLEEDGTDSSVTRPLALLSQLLKKAGLRCVRQRRQEKFPNGLYPVYMIASRPCTDKSGSGVSNSTSAEVTSQPVTDTSENRMSDSTSEEMVSQPVTDKSENGGSDSTSAEMDRRCDSDPCSGSPSQTGSLQISGDTTEGLEEALRLNPSGIQQDSINEDISAPSREILQS